MATVKPSWSGLQELITVLHLSSKHRRLGLASILLLLHRDHSSVDDIFMPTRRSRVLIPELSGNIMNQLLMARPAGEHANQRNLLTQLLRHAQQSLFLPLFMGSIPRVTSTHSRIHSVQHTSRNFKSLHSPRAYHVVAITRTSRLASLHLGSEAPLARVQHNIVKPRVRSIRVLVQLSQLPHVHTTS